MSKGAASGERIGFGNSEAGAGYLAFDTEAARKATNKSSLASANITDKLDDGNFVFGHMCPKIFAES